MSGSKYGWWSYCKDIIRRYPQLCEEREAIQTGTMIADYSGQPKGGIGDIAALRTLPPAKEREYLSVSDAINSTMKRWDGAERVKLIETVFWTKGTKLEGAAQKCHVSYRTARRWHSDFIVAVAENMGIKDRNEPRPRDNWDE